MIHFEAGFISPGEVVLCHHWIEAQDDQTLVSSLRRFAALSRHPYLEQTHCGGLGDFDSIEAFLAAVEADRVQTVSQARKRELVPERRREFAVSRTHLELALIDRDGYVCSHPGCGAASDLTIDHIVALSRGGTDDLANLCFLCRTHNSSKGDH